MKIQANLVPGTLKACAYDHDDEFERGFRAGIEVGNATILGIYEHILAVHRQVLEHLAGDDR